MDVTLDESASSTQSTPVLRQQLNEIKDNIVKGKYTVVTEAGKSKVWEIFGKVE